MEISILRISDFGRDVFMQPWTMRCPENQIKTFGASHKSVSFSIIMGYFVSYRKGTGYSPMDDLTVILPKTSAGISSRV